MTKKEVALIRKTIESLTAEAKGLCGYMPDSVAIADLNARADCLGWLLEITGNEDSLPEFMKEENLYAEEGGVCL